MCRSTLVSLLAFVTGLGAPSGGIAAPPLPSGTITCVVHGDVDQGGGRWRLRFSPWLTSTPNPRRTRIDTILKGTCDGSGVSGATAPITNVKAYLVGKLPAGSSCSTLPTAMAVDQLRIRIIWQTTDGISPPHKVATSTAKLGSAQWDGGLAGPVFTNGPLKGAFGGSTSTLKLSMDYPQAFGSGCTGPLDGDAYGDDGNSSLTIP